MKWGIEDTDLLGSSTKIFYLILIMLANISFILHLSQRSLPDLRGTSNISRSNRWKGNEETIQEDKKDIDVEQV